MNNFNSEIVKVIVVGASGFGRESLDVLQAMIEAGSSVEIVGVIDDYPSPINVKRLENRDVRFIGSIDYFLENFDRDVRYLLGIGNPAIREMLVEKVEAAGFTPFIAIHPTAIIGTELSHSSGVIVCAGAVISTNVRLGNHVHINPNVTIGHDSILEDFVSVNPAAVISGEVVLKKSVLVGANATILQGLVIEQQALVGASSCVTKNVPSKVIVKGIPAC